MNKLRKTAKTMDIVIRAILWIAVVVGVINFGISAWLAVSLLRDPDMILTAGAGLDVDYLFFHIAPGYITSPEFGMYLNLMKALSAAVIIPLICWALRILRGILQPMTCGKPFDQHVSWGLKKLGSIAVILGVLENVIRWIGIAFVDQGYDLSRLFRSESIIGITVDYKLDLNFLLIAGLLFLLSCIFRYGEELQQLSDETL